MRDRESLGERRTVSKHACINAGDDARVGGKWVEVNPDEYRRAANEKPENCQEQISHSANSAVVYRLIVPRNSPA